jgi:hypothetical protein
MFATRISGPSSWQKCSTPSRSTTGPSGQVPLKSAIARCGSIPLSPNPLKPAGLVRPGVATSSTALAADSVHVDHALHPIGVAHRERVADWAGTAERLFCIDRGEPLSHGVLGSASLASIPDGCLKAKY